MRMQLCRAVFGLSSKASAIRAGLSGPCSRSNRMMSARLSVRRWSDAGPSNLVHEPLVASKLMA
jgi:hypothetical protein